ncbi:MAG: hypothetical protein V4729_02300 [Pseudomonadota bacterium]
MNRFFSLVPAALILLTTSCVQIPEDDSQEFAQLPAAVLASLPYELNVEKLAAFDPRPLAFTSFSPDSDPKAKGVRIVSSGRTFPYIYEIISVPGVSSPSVLDSVSKSLDGKPGIILKQVGTNPVIGDHVHFFQRFDLNGIPNHVSSNYIFVKNGTFYHLSASNYGPTIIKRSSWGAEKPDPNAEGEVNNLISSMIFK